ncbi:MAG: NAD(+)/NADH kinase [Deltaproteobacteria bacterium]|nr:NAD(+)/NADH kinase [Deltaproteobacteria bacterium]
MMKKIGLIVKASNPQAVKLGCGIALWAASRGVEVYVAADERAGKGIIKPAKAVPPGELAGSVDVMAVLGGDGTMLSAARLINGKKVPIIGVNMGGLGFLTALTANGDVYPALERIINGDYETEERMMLTVLHLRGGECLRRCRALNDAVIRGGAARLVRLETRINMNT